MNFENIKPTDIEKRSFEILSGILDEMGIILDPENEPVIKRAIHTTADFDYAQNLYFSLHAVSNGIRALREGCCIVTDTQMAKAGINKKTVSELGGEVYCFMSDEDVAKAGLAAMEDWMKKIGVAMSLSELGATEDMIEGIAEGTFILEGGYKVLTRDEVVKILKESL